MYKSLRPFERLWRDALFCLALLGGALFFCRQSQAQAIISSATDVTGLQDALINGDTNVLLQFDGTMNPPGVFEIIENVTLDGTGSNPVIGGTNNQIFYVDPGVTFTLINVTLSGTIYTAPAGMAGVAGGNGTSKGGAGGAGGAGSNALGGAVYNAGNSTFINCLFLTNEAIGGAGAVGGNGGNGTTPGNGGNGGSGGSAYGGAIYNIGTVVLSNCTIAGNVVEGGAGAAGGTNGSGSFNAYPGAGGGGGIGSGAGIYNLGKLTIINTTINQNACVSGSASTSGGGVPSGNGNGVAGPTGPVSEGGGVCNFGTNTFLNCTFFANTATAGNGGNGGAASSSGFDGGNGGNGGSAYGGNVFNGPGGILAMTNCTISGGALTAGTNGTGGTGPINGQNGSPGGVDGANIANLNSGATFLLKNSILDFPTNTTSAYGTITDQGNNISSDSTPTFTTTNSFNSKDPGLTPSGLQPNGSSVVLTIALSSTSPAINAIYDDSAPSYDERGFVRPGKIRPDIGAFEFGSFAATYNVTGQVLMGDNPFPGVTVIAGQSSSVTDSNGDFSLTLATNANAVITPKPQGYFSPSTATVNVVSNVSGLLFKATNAFGRITNIVNGAGTNTNSLSLTFTGIPGFNYVIEAATNLVPPIVWTNLSTNPSGSNGIMTFTYVVDGTNLTNFPKRFFRAVPPP